MAPPPRTSDLVVERIASEALPPAIRREIVDLCSEAYEETFDQYLEDVGPGVHLFGRVEGTLAAHLMWVPRLLEVGSRLGLRTAYVEAVATRPAFQRRGLASALLRRCPTEVADFDLAALCPSDAAFYQRLGWQLWRGPLFIRTPSGPQSTPEEQVMILPLPKTPLHLPLDAPLSAEWRKGELW